MSEKTIEFPSQITVRDLAQRMEASPIQVIKILMSNGVMANINQQVDFDTAAVVASELGFEAVLESVKETAPAEDPGKVPLWRELIDSEDKSKLINRPPVVTILGHVDHGKTTLLDAIRHANVASGEAGGITQHIGAYQVEHKGKVITFLDTPGHAAFSAMRARGAQGADIVILVVAADDGVMPQTREAIAHAKAARVPIIVALNKIDRADANPDFVKRQLSEQGLVPDEWDGNTIVVPVSAKQKKGLDDILEAVLLVSESLDIKANPHGKVFGTVIEAQVDKARGVIATLLVQNGTLQTGNTVIVGDTCGKIRAMYDFNGKTVKSAFPSTPIQVLGIGNVPPAGELFQVVPSEKEARLILAERAASKENGAETSTRTSLEKLFEKFQAGEVRELPLILKVDVQGSVEPIVNSLNELSQGEIKINVIHAETGNISESDVMLAAASRAILLGFNVSADQAARNLAEQEGISIRLYNIIYRMIEDIEKALKGMLEPETREIPVGTAQVRAVFKISKVGTIAGCRVLTGELRRNARIRLLREGETLFDGEISSLKHEKDDVKEVRQGFECGVSLKGYNDINEGDLLENYIIEKSA
ncbi:MAG TPA: translation initiation factor IF-2 [Anaerolineaceae bacterium]|jgi:translation initiation factor IF-2|nr:translation initiation factor IF-2 [Anaerolineaceae bacterium]NMC18130.1 translation initiation factor IF-2 [Chloroflexota bacterium]HNS07649.1 translation initiation factor IF-2 [Anaerolineaceae bacterium]HNW13828.1 translation initiation factor IF-2 [Anaerolineaceae bacterium]HOE01893.1 translation initiation factor IF-2 [Anaerolineaceae bacterium]